MKTLFNHAVLVPAVAFVLFLSTVSTAFADDGVASQFKGYTEIDRLIHERIASTNGFELGKYLGENTPEPSTSGLLQLLGTYLGSDTDAAFRNGEPNSLNMILWYIALSGLGKEVALLCQAPISAPTPTASPVPTSKLVPNAQFLVALQPLCAWPADSAKTNAVMSAYWIAIMSFDAPQDEYEQWRDYFLNDPGYSLASPSTVIAAMTLAALYNPYFLLSN